MSVLFNNFRNLVFVQLKQRCSAIAFRLLRLSFIVREFCRRILANLRHAPFDKRSLVVVVVENDVQSPSARMKPVDLLDELNGLLFLFRRHLRILGFAGERAADHCG
jgi:hypothetical protein